VRVMLADDAVLFREGMARILIEAGFEVAGQARDAAELLDLVRRDPPAAAIIDIRMPPGQSAEGIEAAVEIRRMSPGVGLLLLSQHVETHHAMRLMTEFQGGVGYLLKDRVSDLATFASDVRRVANGDCVIDPELVARLVDKKREGDPLAALTERERRVLALMAQGRSNSALSMELFLSGKTVEAHVRSIFTKLNLAPDAGDHRRVLAVLAFLRS
jgi:DNA-binding NarL/FixJ family response regulator